MHTVHYMVHDNKLRTMTNKMQDLIIISKSKYDRIPEFS